MTGHTHRRGARLVLLAGALLAVGCGGEQLGGSGGTEAQVERMRKDRAVFNQPEVWAPFEKDFGPDRKILVEHGIKMLVEKPADPEIAQSWHGPYLKPEQQSSIIDEWGEPYFVGFVFAKAGAAVPMFWSKGPDKQAYTPDDVWDFADQPVYTPLRGKP